jgi:hypothetical protein
MIYEIVSCASLYYDWGNKNDKWGGGDSFDREFVRDMMLYGRGIRLEDLEFGKGVGEFIKEFTEDRKTIEIDLSLN